MENSVNLEEIFWDINFKAEKINDPKIYEQIAITVERQKEILEMKKVDYRKLENTYTNI